MDEVGVEETDASLEADASPEVPRRRDRLVLRDLGARGFGNAGPQLLDMEDATGGFGNAAPRLLDMEGALDDIEGATDDGSRGFGNAVPPLLDMEVALDEDAAAPDEASHPLAVHASDPFG